MLTPAQRPRPRATTGSSTPPDFAEKALAVKQEDPEVFRGIDALHKAGLPMRDIRFHALAIFVVFDEGQAGLTGARFCTMGKQNASWGKLEGKVTRVLEEADFRKVTWEQIKLPSLR
jgi:hypothetical protein